MFAFTVWLFLIGPRWVYVDVVVVCVFAWCWNCLVLFVVVAAMLLLFGLSLYVLGFWFGMCMRLYVCLL